MCPESENLQGWATVMPRGRGRLVAVLAGVGVRVQAHIPGMPVPALSRHHPPQARPQQRGFQPQARLGTCAVQLCLPCLAGLGRGHDPQGVFLAGRIWPSPYPPWAAVSRPAECRNGSNSPEAGVSSAVLRSVGCLCAPLIPNVFPLR